MAKTRSQGKRGGGSKKKENGANGTPDGDQKAGEWGRAW